MEDYDFSRDAEFHTLSLMKDFFSEKPIPENYGDNYLGDSFLKIMKATQTVINEEMRVLKGKYSHRALFINSGTYGRIKEVIGRSENQDKR